MFLVFDREKIGSYLIVLSTVFILFGTAISLKRNNTKGTYLYKNNTNLTLYVDKTTKA